MHRMINIKQHPYSTALLTLPLILLKSHGGTCLRTIPLSTPLPRSVFPRTKTNDFQSFSRDYVRPPWALRNRDRLGILRKATISQNIHDGDIKNVGQLKKNDNMLWATVVVKRGRQSMAFRNGSPLVFSGAVAYTSKVVMASDDVQDGDCEPLLPGSIVAVAVESKADSGSAAKKKSRRKKNHENMNKEGKKAQSVYPHYTRVIDERGGSSFSSIENPQVIGFGVYNPSSMYRVRILCHAASNPYTFGKIKTLFSSHLLPQKEENEKHSIALILRTKIHGAIESRKALGLPSSETDSFRLFNGEGDGLSGLAVDILGGRVAVVMSSAAWCEIYKTEIISQLKKALQEFYQNNVNEELELIWKTTESRLKQDGYDGIIEDESLKTVNNQGSNSMLADKRVVATESGIKYNTFPYQDGQKTGFYCDQRENRVTLAQLCKGKRVLDLCCYNGSFSLNAIKHGALSCVGVDSSQDAVNSAIGNALLNDMEESCTFIRDDIVHYMKETYDRGEYFDVIVLDPPKLAPSLSGLERASRKYQTLNRDAMKLLCPQRGGLLLSCSCSGAMTQKDGGQFFLQTVKSASISARRHITLLKVSGAAACHTQCPASFPAGAYLTAALFSVNKLEEN